MPLLCRVQAPNDNQWNLAMIDAIKRSSAKRITASFITLVTQDRTEKVQVEHQLLLN